MKAEAVIEFRKPVSIQQMSCTVCGAQADASCNCGAPYLPAKKKAEQAIAANPEKSNRAIAADIGVSDMTVGRARKEGATSVAPEMRIGLDGKSYPAKQERSSELPAGASDLAAEYRKCTMAHTSHLALADKDFIRAGRALISLKEVIEATNADWWSFYADNFDKPRNYAEKAMRATLD